MKYYDLSEIKPYRIERRCYQEFLDIDNRVSYEDFVSEYLVRRRSYIIVEICEFINKFKFVTPKQLNEYIELIDLDMFGIDSKDLCKYNVLSEVALAKHTSDDDEVKEENIALCIGSNGIEFLKKYSSVDVHKWMIKDVSNSAEKILRYILCADIYINLLKSYGNKIINSCTLNPFPRFVGKSMITIDMEFYSNENALRTGNIIQIIREYDINDSFWQKINKLERFLGTNAWKSMSNISSKPYVIFVCEDENMINKVKDMLYNSSLLLNTEVYFTHDCAIREKLITDNDTLFLLENGNLNSASLSNVVSKSSGDDYVI